MKTKKVYLSLGSNSGDRKRMLREAVFYIEAEAGRVLKKSGVYETEPWGNTMQPLFLNQVIEISTELEAYALLDTLLSIEKRLGRERGKQRWQQRTIDIDILFIEQSVLSEGRLLIPHPELHKRKFVLSPLNEIEPGFIHPLLHKTVSELLNECSDPLQARKTEPSENDGLNTT
ncbi:MAG TPA: 2-amino-4-hydroxy-6-hydroxymethyldihydropteridine diphosphokinase [Bacteroidia bacterium]|nr:2-amino-4-hydroxy-6-hydroxymethyldihydropteridine diphosphokinase [Bacteroidia bacterium]